MQAFQKYVYFPLPHQPNRAPRVIYVSETGWGDGLKGNTSEEELQNGRFEFFPARRCQIFSPRLWEECVQWVEQFQKLEEQYKRLMKKGIMEPLPEREFVDVELD